MKLKALHLLERKLLGLIIIKKGYFSCRLQYMTINQIILELALEEKICLIVC